MRVSNLEKGERERVLVEPKDDSTFNLLMNVSRCPFEENRTYFVDLFLNLSKGLDDETGLKYSYAQLLATLTPTQIKILKSLLSGYYWLDEKHSLGIEDVDVKKIDWSEKDKISGWLGKSPAQGKALVARYHLN